MPNDSLTSRQNNPAPAVPPTSGGMAAPDPFQQAGANQLYQTIAQTQFAATHPAGSINPALAVLSPRDVAAGILRGQWGQFESSTVPIVKGLEDMTTYAGNPGVVEGLKTEARNNAKAAFGNVLPDAQRQAQSYGMSLSSADAGTLERASKLGMAAATVDGVNRANQYQQDLNRQIAGGAQLAPLKTT